MNIRLNKILGIIEVVLVFLLVMIFLVLRNISLLGSDFELLRSILFISTIILEIFIVSIELLLFIVYKKNVKFLYMMYLICELFISIVINKYVAFSGFFMIGIFSIIKMILRLKYVSKIYNRTYFKRYCKLFNIKLSTAKPKKRKVTRKKTKKRITNTSRKQINSYA